MKQVLFFIGICMILACSNDLPLPKGTENCEVVNAKFDTAVILVMGQSNAANLGSHLYASSCQNAKSYYLGDQYPLADPLRGANGIGGSVWSRMTDVLLEGNFANQIIIAPAAVGGTRIGHWAPGGALEHLYRDQIVAIQQDGLKITHVLWHQGESNNASLYPSVDPIQNADNYSTLFLLLVENLRSMGVDAPVFIAATTRCGSRPIDIDLQQAQLDLADTTLGIFNGPNTDLLDNHYRYDECHFNEEGLSVHALLWANILLNH